MANPPNSIPFTFLTSLLREIARVSAKGSHAHAQPTLNTFQYWVQELNKRFSPVPQGTTATVFRMLFPEEDAQRKYDMQERTLAHELSHVFGMQSQRYQTWNSETSTGCLGLEIQKSLEEVCPTLDGGISPLSIHQVDQLLDELAANSSFSHATIRAKYPQRVRRPRRLILRLAFRSLFPEDAAFLVQIILKDLRPLLYPLVDVHYTIALKEFTSTSVKMLTKEQAMNAWDTTGWMLRNYRARSDLCQVAAEFEDPQVRLTAAAPRIPKSQKGRSCHHALSFFTGSKRVWAETKYDGERAQIHVEFRPNGSPSITIFSKSKRDSTADRFAIHKNICQSLLLDLEPASRKVKSNIILDAEMVAVHGNSIDEFWRIRGLIESTAHGVRGARNRVAVSTDPQHELSQNSMDTDVSESRHLALVFFDVLLVDSVSLLYSSYSHRRGILESLITLIPGEVMLAERVPIDMHPDHLDDSLQSLRKVFAESIADHQEGLVLKACESRYNDFRLPWVKLKKDYIPGYGDTLDLVIAGAGWDKNRARELRVAPTVLTTFYVGSIANSEALRQDPTLEPHLHIYFTVSYGLSRDELEEVNFLIKNSEPLQYDAKMTSSLPYRFTIYPGILPPALLLHTPLLAELFGAGFTKSPKSKHYELRFPRLTKIYRTVERCWREAVNLEDLHKIARECIGRDRSLKDVDDWCNDLWGKPTSPGVNSALKRKTTATVWEHKLAALDGGVIKRQKLPMKARNPNRKTETDRTDPKLDDPQPSNPKPNVGVTRPPGSPTNKLPQRLTRGTGRYKFPVTPVQELHTDPRQAPKTTISKVTQRIEPDPDATFFITALVWFAGPRKIGHKSPCLRWKGVVPRHRQLHSLESLLAGCGWENDRVSNGVDRGVIFVNGDTEVWGLHALNIIQKHNRPGKPICFVDAATGEVTHTIK